MKHTARTIRFEDALKPGEQYTYTTTIGNQVYARARATDGTPVFVEQNYAPTYFTPTNETLADARGYDGTPLQSRRFDSIHDGRKFIERSRTGVFGDIGPEYMVIGDCYGTHDVPFNFDRLYIWNFDIEVDRDQVRGYAPVEDPFNPIVAITVRWRHMGERGTVIYGYGNYVPKKPEFYVKCENEEEMLLRYLDDFRAGGDYPDIITGWNIQFYDVPYMVNRLKMLFSEETWSRMSPFSRLTERVSVVNFKEKPVIDIRGISILDYYEVYRKHTLQQREDYKLNTIASIELKRTKTDYTEHRSLDQLMREDYQKFIEYNVNDVLLVEELDDKLKLLELVVALAYAAKANFSDTFRQVRLWDVMIYHKLRQDGTQIPPRREVEKTSKYAGAFVKEPIIGQHLWVMSFDVASMYPHIIREWNLSPEMMIPERVSGLSVDALLEQRVDTSMLRDMDACLAANGLLCRREREGFLPSMLKTLYDERVKFKNMEKAAKSNLKTLQAEIAKDGETPARLEQQAELIRNISAYGNQQKVRKVNLNSAYGACGSAYFRYYDLAIAEAVTLTGQLVIRWIAKDVNAYMNKMFKTNEEYIIASDTDSVYVRMEIVAKSFKESFPNATTEQIVEMLDQFGAKRIQPVLNKAFNDIAEYLNVAVPCLTMVRDVIADKAIWTAKKHYIMNVWDVEGLRYTKPELKMMGISAVQSSTPAICREMLTKALTMLMTGTERELQEHILSSRQRFNKSKFADIAFPRSCNNLNEYTLDDKGIPIQVRAALTYNAALERTGLSKRYEPIFDGEKIKFVNLRLPNVYHSHVMGAPGTCPDEWHIERDIDYDLQFEKAVLAPLNDIIKYAGWTAEFTPSLFD